MKKLLLAISVTLPFLMTGALAHARRAAQPDMKRTLKVDTVWKCTGEQGSLADVTLLVDGSGSEGAERIVKGKLVNEMNSVIWYQTGTTFYVFKAEYLPAKPSFKGQMPTTKLVETPLVKLVYKGLESKDKWTAVFTDSQAKMDCQDFK